jgi:uncharacterized protein (UPF0264 family)
VRNLAEAQLAAQARVDFIDLKEPDHGALGGLAPADIARIVRELRRLAPGVPISATIGDWPADALADIRERVQQVAACGVDHVKVGIDPATASGPQALAELVDQLGRLKRDGLPLVPVLIADRGVDAALLQQICAQHFFAVMLDTADKRGGSLLQRLGTPELAAVIAQVRAHGSLIGLAGALQPGDLPALRALAPDFAGFRSAVCVGDRRQGLDASRLALLMQVLGV